MGHQLQYAPALFELHNFAQRQARGLEPPLALRSTQDTTIIAMLVSLGVWDGVWPPYTDTMVLETYRARSNTSRSLFRLLRHGKALRFQSDHKPVVEGLYDLEQFLPSAVSRLRDKNMWSSLCKRPFHESSTVLAGVAVATPAESKS